MTNRPDPARYQVVGPRKYLDRLLAEYELSDADVAGAIIARTPGTEGRPGPAEYLIRASLLRPHDPFPCAGDAEAREFCLAIATEMMLATGVSQREAIARINQFWSEPEPGKAGPRVWIVGLDLAYHEDEGFWARVMLGLPH